MVDREKVVFREALELELDKDDVVLRRRLGQNLEFLSADLLEPAQPKEIKLRAYVADNQDAYRDEEVVTVTRFFFDPDKRRGTALEDANATLAELWSAPTRRAIWENSAIIFCPGYFAQISRRELARQFGDGFAEPLFARGPNAWHGPLLSGCGTHLVYIHNYETAPEPFFENLKQQVTRGWFEAKRTELNEAFASQFDVIVERPATAFAVSVDVPN